MYPQFSYFQHSTMRFRTEIDLLPTEFSIDHNRIGFMAGSCFSQHIADRLSQAKFNVTVNPSGILFNPESIASLIDRLARKSHYSAEDLFFSDGLWHCYDTHGVFSSDSARQTLEKINDSLTQGAETLFNADYVILTFGTAWVYRLAATGSVVANCHKQPAHLFRREQLSAEHIVRLFSPLLEGPLADKQVLFTVSPVRHLKDGLSDNFLSKSILRCAIDSLQKSYDNTYYFPAFEILNDDLRDYRFYAEDMLHPSPQAIDYVWEKFTAFAMNDHTRSLLPKLAKLSAAMQHRILHNQDSHVETFRQSSLRLVEELKKSLPDVNFEHETKYFSAL